MRSQFLTRNHVRRVEATTHAPNAQWPWDKRRWRRTLCASLPRLLVCAFPIRAQQTKYADEATFDDKGNIFVSSDGGMQSIGPSASATVRGPSTDISIRDLSPWRSEEYH